jgi:hypothetical protein
MWITDRTAGNPNSKKLEISFECMFETFLTRFDSIGIYSGLFLTFLSK